MTEYIVIVGLIALGLVVAVKNFQFSLEEAFFAGAIRVDEVGEAMEAQ